MGKEISIVVKAYNQTKAAFASVRAGLRDLARGDIGKGFGKFGDALGQMGRTASMVVKRVASGLATIAAGAAAAGAAVVAISRKAIAAYQDQVQAETRLRQALKNTSFAAGFNASQLKAMATELQKTTGVQDEATLSLMAMLAASGQVRGVNFTRAVQASLDLSAALRKTGEDSAGVEEAAQALAKALSDPEEGMARLARKGIIFTDAQKQAAKAMAEAGDAAGAQNLILAEIEKRYGGTAVAAFQANKGVVSLKTAFNEAQEAIGAAIQNANQFNEKMASVADAVQKFTESGYIEAFVNRVAASLATLTDAFRSFGETDFGKTIKEGLMLIPNLVAKVAAFMGALTKPGGGGLAERMKGAAEAFKEADVAKEFAAEANVAKGQNAKRQRMELEADAKAQEAAKPELARADAEVEAARVAEAAKKAQEIATKAAAEAEREAAKAARIVADEAERAARAEEHRLALMRDIADANAELANRDQRAQWDRALEVADKQLDAAQAEIEARRAMGAAGSKELAGADAAKKRREQDLAGIAKGRERLGLQEIGKEALGAMTPEQIDEEKRRQQILGMIGGRKVSGLTDNANADEIIAAARKRGFGLSRKDQEMLRRADMDKAVRAAADAKKFAQEKLDAQNALEQKMWRNEMIAKTKDMNVQLATIAKNTELGPIG